MFPYLITSVRIALQTWMPSFVLFSNPATLFTPKMFICKPHSAKHQNLLLTHFQYIGTRLFSLWHKAKKEIRSTLCKSLIFYQILLIFSFTSTKLSYFHSFFVCKFPYVSGYFL